MPAPLLDTKAFEDLRISSPPRSEESGRQMRISDLENALLSKPQISEMEELISQGPEKDSKKRNRSHFEASHYDDECMDFMTANPDEIIGTYCGSML